jgi:mRNA-degrading endonuclease RelE of RelBE toxin-antitoxin system
MTRDVVSSPDENRYRLQIVPSAANALSESLPEKVALAVFEFINGPLLENPDRVGIPLRAPLAPAYSARRGSYRLLYLIDEETRTLKVTVVAHRGHAYRS